MAWSFIDGVPIYLQIIDEMSIRIASGSLKPGERLPSVRDLAMDAGVNPNTMQRSLRELERMGLLYAERTSGRFVTEDFKVIKKMRNDLALRYTADLFARLQNLGMDGEEIVTMVRTYAGNGDVKQKEDEE